MRQALVICVGGRKKALRILRTVLDQGSVVGRNVAWAEGEERG